MLRTVLISIVGCVVCWRCGAATLPTAQVDVALYNDAGVSEGILRHAQEVAAEIYGKAGVALLWNRCGRQVPDQVGDRHVCSRSDVLSIRIVAKSLSLRNEHFGVAFLGEDGTGTQADVFHSGIEKLTQHDGSDEAVVLGHVIAHELGHLLLGMNAHSRAGIMQARWTNTELREMRLGSLIFTDQEATAMRSRVSRESTVAGLRERRD